MSVNGTVRFIKQFETFDEAFDYLDEKSSDGLEIRGKPLFLIFARIQVNYNTKKWEAIIEYGTHDPQSDFDEADDLVGGW